MYYKAFSFKGMLIVTIMALHNRFIHNGKRSKKGIKSLSELRGGFINITGLYD
jgi:hypothetical protein